MFIRTKKSPNSVKTSVQLVENIRSKGKVSQKVIRHFGSAINDDELNVLFKLAETYKNNLLNELKGPSLFPNDAIQERILKRLDSVQLSALDADTSTNSTQEHENIKSNPPLIVDLRCLEEEKRIHCGSFMVYETIFKMLRFDTIFGSSRKRTALVKMLKNIVIARIEKPVSKLATTVYLSELRGINYDVNSVYRMMDYFTPEVIEGVQNRSYEYIKTLFGEEINVFFYDCTTLYFESFIEDELKKNGFGKDGKFNQPQVVLGLLVTPQGMPVGYELYEGGKFEGHTLNEAIKRLKEKYKIKKFCFVADAALLNGDNIKNFENAKQPFIVGARIKNMSKLTTQSILDKSKYSALYKDSKNEEEIGVTYQDLTLDNGLRLIVTYSPKRAKKNKYDREKAIEKARKELVKGKSASAIVNNKGYKRYFKLEKDSKVVLNEAKLKADEQ
ncbi:MAG: IS1634 family transposase, partial [Sediminibacterium sp.]|nr:IS1634 family transposase [Sediminibacterium sp.]